VIGRRAVAGLALLGVLALVPAACGGQAAKLEATPVTTVPGPYTFDYTIPEGTASKIAMGRDPKVMPTSITANVGDTIRIVNDDRKSHTVGTFYVLAGTTLTYRFTTPGVFEGVCSTNPSDTFILTVLA
jgi:plastocyanin